MTPERISYLPGISKQMWLCHFKLLISETNLQHLPHYRPGCSFLLMPSDTTLCFFELEINQSIFDTTNSLLALFLCCGSNPLKSDFFSIRIRFFFICEVALQLWFPANNTTAENHISPLFPSSGNSFPLLLLSINVFWVTLFCWQVWSLP